MNSFKDWDDCLPKFYGDGQITVEKHVSTFQDYTDDIWVEHEDVFMGMLNDSIEGHVREWVRNFPPNSI